MTTSEHGAATTVDPELIAMMDGVFAEYRGSQPPVGSLTRDAGWWQKLDQLGLVRLTGSDRYGGSGAGWHEGAELISAAVRHGVRIPLAEHDLLACWLLETLDQPIDDAARTVCVLDDFGTATAVPWASTSERIVVLWRDGDRYRLADMDAAALLITPGTNVIGEPRDTVVCADPSPAGTEVAPELVAELHLKAALIRAIQVCAALDSILALTIEHTSARIQFGRSLSKFQAIQHMVSDIAAETALARAATDAALAVAVAGDWSTPKIEFAVAVARSCTGHAASVVVRNAHQAHGAIGTTIEHRLHEYTRAALAWRSEFGSVQHWDDQVTSAALAAGATGLWGLIAD